MPPSANFSEANDEPYKRQMTSYRRTRTAILESTKDLLALKGLTEMSMIDIADTAQVSRATLYNHFRNKESVIRGLLEDEISKIIELMEVANSPEDALSLLSMEISLDPALFTLRQRDPALLTQLLSSGADPLWAQLHEALASSLSSLLKVELTIRWLIGQVFAPLTQEQSRAQAKEIVGMLAD